MKKIIYLPKTWTLLLVVFFVANIAIAQKKISGTVYREGKPAAGVTVTAHKSSESFFTSFDGFYEINVSEKSKWLKFVFMDEEGKISLEENTSDIIDFAFDGILPGEIDEADINTQTQAQLIAAKDKDYMNDLALYTQLIKQKAYNQALVPWKTIYTKYPKSSKNVYIHGADIYEGLLEKETNPQKRNILIEELLKMYDKRIKYFNEEGKVLGMKGLDYLKFKVSDDILKSEAKAADVLKGRSFLEKSIELESSKANATTVYQYFNTSVVLFKSGEYDAENVVASFDKCIKIAEMNLEKDSEDPNAIWLYKSLEKSFANSGAASCEALVEMYQIKFNENPEDIQLLKKISRMLNKQDCTDYDLYDKVAEKRYQLEPSAGAAYSMARLFLKKQDIDKSIKYYKEAIDSEGDSEMLARYYHELGLLTLSKKKDFQSARNYARKAIQSYPEWGAPYLLMGDIYAQYSKHYGKDDFEHKSLYWLAVDYFKKAMRVDVEVTEEAKAKIATYSVYFPNKEEAFFHGVKTGDMYQYEDWINETTTVRTKK